MEIIYKSAVSLRLSKTMRAKAFTLMLREPQHDTHHVMVKSSLLIFLDGFLEYNLQLSA